MADKKKTLLLRISPELWEELSRRAAGELRSVNGLIEYLLRTAMRDPRPARPTFWGVYPWIRKLMADLRAAEAGGWARRMQRAIWRATSEEECAGNLLAVLEELKGAGLELPVEMKMVMDGLAGAMEQMGGRR